MSDDERVLDLILDKLKVLEQENKVLLESLTRLEERIVGKKSFDRLERRVDTLEKADARRKGVVAGLSVAGGGVVVTIVEAVRALFR